MYQSQYNGYQRTVALLRRVCLIAPLEAVYLTYSVPKPTNTSDITFTTSPLLETSRSIATQSKRNQDQIFVILLSIGVFLCPLILLCIVYTWRKHIAAQRGRPREMTESGRRNSFLPPYVPPPAYEEQHPDETTSFFEHHRSAITLDVEQRLRNGGWELTQNPSSISKERWRNDFGLTAQELKNLAEAYERY